MPMNIVIQEKRKQLGLTQEQVADYLGVSTPALFWTRCCYRPKPLMYPQMTLKPKFPHGIRVWDRVLMKASETVQII